MNDRFKFRVYIKYAKMMCYDVNSFYIDRLKNKITIHFDDHTKTFKFDDVVLEQSTGLKDKNGKLIYEGDIVRVIEKCMTNTLDRNYPMLFNEKTAKFGFKHPEGHFFYFTNNDDFSYEVIGNIHENSDLLEADNAD
jgi:uncharacterized phage protein (TIGR01671 family)